MKTNYTIRLILVLGISSLMYSCTSLTKFSSAKTIDINAAISQKPTVADLDIKENKVSGTSSGKTPYSIEAVKTEAVANALKTANADILVEPKFDISIDKATVSVTVTGYPAFYKNFRPIKAEDIILLEALIIRKELLVPGTTTVKPVNTINPIK